MTWWEALILGLVQGVTEYLPVSSSGHLILAAWLLGLREDAGSRAAMNTFDLVLHMATIVAVAGLYWRRCRQIGLGLVGRDPAGLRLAVNIVIGFVPVVFVGLLLKDMIRGNLYGPWPIVTALLLGGVLMLAVHHHPRLKRLRVEGASLDRLTWQVALLIGLGQCLALWPGVSRAMMTVVVALVLGMRAKAAAEFSFLLGLLTISAITIYETYDGGSAMLEHLDVLPVIVGFVAATVSAGLAVKWFVGFLTRQGLAPFGWYRIAMAGVMLALLALGLIDAGAFYG
ncbi:MAG: undecaprenyl-diphosphate phosphatase [Phycisphaeraceae bacterium]